MPSSPRAPAPGNARPGAIIHHLRCPALAVAALAMTGCARPHPTWIGSNVPREKFPRQYDCPKVNVGPTIDGRLDEEAWEQAAWSGEFIDIEGFSRPRPRHTTHMKLLWDDEHLYIAAWLEEPHVWATLSERDAIVFHDNDFEVFIDPDGDSREYYELEFNALNTVFDLFLVRTYLAGGPALHDWDMRGLTSAVHVEGTLNNAGDIDDGWTIEMALPWRSLAEAAGRDAPPKAGDVWRMNFSRVEWQHRMVDGRYEKVPDTREDNWVWSPQGVVNMHVPRKWGYVRFVAKQG